jgi:hypothetical protein
MAIDPDGTERTERDGDEARGSALAVDAAALMAAAAATMSLVRLEAAGRAKPRRRVPFMGDIHMIGR